VFVAACVGWGGLGVGVGGGVGCVVCRGGVEGRKVNAIAETRISSSWQQQEQQLHKQAHLAVTASGCKHPERSAAPPLQQLKPAVPSAAPSCWLRSTFQRVDRSLGKGTWGRVVGGDGWVLSEGWRGGVEGLRRGATPQDGCISCTHCSLHAALNTTHHHRLRCSIPPAAAPQAACCC